MIVRTKTKATGGITPEERIRLDAVAQKWINVAMRTDPIEPEKIIPAIEGLYAAAKLKKPRVVIVPSPLVMAFAYGASAWIWHCRSSTDPATDLATRSATDFATESATFSATFSATESATFSATDLATFSATRSATVSATDSATDLATLSATESATFSATDLATRSATVSATDSATALATDSAADSATRSATDFATESATFSATFSATRSATFSATDSATDLATYSATESATFSATDLATRSTSDEAVSGAIAACLELAGEGGIKCAGGWINSYQGGNMWAGWCSYLAGFRDVLGLDLPEHAAYQFYEDAAMHGGFRVMHEEFCIVSDFPEIIKKDDQNRPHCEDGPSHRWRDGWSLYHWHGVSIPAEWITDKASLSAKTALTWGNIEQRRAACEIIGWNRILQELSAKVIDEDGDPEIGVLLEVDLPDSGTERFLRVQCGTKREFAIPVPKDCGDTALEANAWTYGLDKYEYKPEIRT